LLAAIGAFRIHAAKSNLNMRECNMSTLLESISRHTARTACGCGRCVDRDETTADVQTHTADVGFFKVSLVGELAADDLRSLIAQHEGEFCHVDPFDGVPHSMEELGGWLGDQEMALRFIGLGHMLGLWHSVPLDSTTVLVPNAIVALFEQGK
jgi:hypothetical protein